MGEQSWPKKPGTQVSSFAGKMTDFKQIDTKNYEKGKSFATARVYGDGKESRLAATPLWEQRISKLGGKDSAWSGGQASSLSARRSETFGEGQMSAWEKKEDFATRSVVRKDGPDWGSRGSPKFQNGAGGLAMYAGRLTRVRETVAREGESSQKRDLGEGRKESFNPSEVQKLLEAKGRTTDPLTPSPVEGKIKVGSAGAFPPGVAGSSPSSP